MAQHISPQKDIDGMHALNLGKIMAEDKEALLPSTVKAVAEILKYYNIEVKGQTVCVVGKSNRWKTSNRLIDEFGCDGN